MIKAFLFDLDGTLVDTHQSNYLAYNRALNEVGVNISYDTFKKSIGYQANTFLPWFAPSLTDEEYKKISESKARHYKDTAKHSILNDRLIDTLKYLKPGHKIILVTTAKRKNAEVILKHHGIENLFDDTICAEDVNESKPSPECYKLALKRNKLKSSEAIAFEDSEPGMRAAEAANIAVVRIGEF